MAGTAEMNPLVVLMKELEINQTSSNLTVDMYGNRIIPGMAIGGSENLWVSNTEKVGLSADLASFIFHITGLSDSRIRNIILDWKNSKSGILVEIQNGMKEDESKFLFVIEIRF